MKPVLFTLLLLISGCGSTINSQAQRSYQRSELGVPYGDVCLIKCTIIPKRNTYFDINLVRAPFLISIEAVNGSYFEDSIVSYPKIDDQNQFEMGKQYTLSAYEEINTIGDPHGWVNLDAQAPYMIVHWIHIKR